MLSITCLTRFKSRFKSHFLLPPLLPNGAIKTRFKATHTSAGLALCSNRSGVWCIFIHEQRQAGQEVTQRSTKKIWPNFQNKSNLIF